MIATNIRANLDMPQFDADVVRLGDEQSDLEELRVRELIDGELPEGAQ